MKSEKEIKETLDFHIKLSKGDNESTINAWHRGFAVALKWVLED